jgi:hypothetical protein
MNSPVASGGIWIAPGTQADPITIANNTFTGPQMFSAVNVEDMSNVTVDSNTITRTGAPSGAGPLISVGLLAADTVDQAGVVVSNNQLTDIGHTSDGIHVESKSSATSVVNAPSLKNNTVQNGNSCIFVGGLVTNPDINSGSTKGCTTGVRLGDGTVGPTNPQLEDVDIENNTTGLKEDHSIGTIFLTNLTILGNGTGGQISSPALDVTANDSANVFTLTPTQVQVDANQALNYSGLGQLLMHGLLGTDTFNVTGPLPQPTTADGGGDADQVNFTGTPNADSIGISTPLISLAGGSDLTLISIEGVSVKGDSGNDQFTVTGPIGIIPITVDGQGGTNKLTVEANSPSSPITITNSTIDGIGTLGTLINYSNVSVVTVNGHGAPDNFLVQAPIGPQLFINGNGGTDDLHVQGTSGDDNLGITATTVTGLGGLLTYTNVHTAQLSGLGGNDTLSAAAPFLNDTTIDGDTGANNNATLTGTGGNDAFVITGGDVTGVGAPVHFVNLNTFTINGAAGDDTFAVNVPASFALRVIGSLGTDSLNVIGPNTARTYDLGGNPLTITPDIGAPISIDPTTENASVLGGTASDSFRVAVPLSKAITVDGNVAGASNHLIVNGTPKADKITVNDSTVTGIGSLLTYLNVFDQTLNGFAGNDQLTAKTVRPDIVNGGDGKDKIDVRDNIHGNDSVDGGASKDKCKADSGDFVVNCP